MSMSVNTLDFLLAVINRFESARIHVWVFGGWAEELWQITPAREHKDIDLLYCGATFEQLDAFIAQNMGFQEIQEKRFSHKRATIFQQVMIEFLLVQQDKAIHFTDFFSGRFRLEWPNDVFCQRVIIPGYNIRIASKQTLIAYRQNHKQVQQACQDFLQLD